LVYKQTTMVGTPHTCMVCFRKKLWRRLHSRKECWWSSWASSWEVREKCWNLSRSRCSGYLVFKVCFFYEW
jgi:hypothetical protein